MDRLCWISCNECFGFNLVIEILLFSGESIMTHFTITTGCFNLVIEILLFSGANAYLDIKKVRISFNLVIEILLFSG